MKKILVTGGAGFIGSHLVDRLAADPFNQVVVLDNLHRGQIANLSDSWSRIQFVEGDIRDRHVLNRVMHGVNLVYHLAAQSNVMGAESDLDYSFTTNVQGTLEVLRSAQDHNVKQLIFTSSREVYGDTRGLPAKETATLRPKNLYGASKAAGEAYCQAFDSPSFDVRIVRLANVYGVRDFGRVIPIFADQALKGETLTLFGGEQVIDFVWIAHVLEGLTRVADADSLPGAINIATGVKTDLRSLARRIIQVARSSSKLRVEPAREIEVAQFVACTKWQMEHLGIESPRDPLLHLPTIVASLSPDAPEPARAHHMSHRASNSAF